MCNAVIGTYLFVSVTCLNQTNLSEVLGSGIVQPQACRQYLYCLTPTGIAAGESTPQNGVGILDIVWRSNLGERGRLQTSQLKRTVSMVEYCIL